MSSQDLIAVGTTSVVAAGHRTAGTAGEWASWAGRCQVAFAELVAAVQDARVAAAGSGYAGRVVPAARLVGQLVGSLGADLVSAGGLLERTDAEAASVLRRPVNGPRRPG